MSLVAGVAEFLTQFFQGTEHQVELRALPCKARVFTRAHNDIASFITRNFDKNNLYFGVATREGRGGDKDHCRELPAFWVDVDFKITCEDAVWKRLEEFPLHPSIFVESGGGLHLYWLLKEPCPAQDARVEPILRGLAQTLGGDLAAAETARIMRLPGTLNRKYDPPRECRQVSPAEWDRKYFLTEFSPFAAKEPPREASAVTGGRVREGQRNSHLTSLAGTMRRPGMSQDAILAALLAENTKCCEPPLSETEVRES